MGLDRHHRECHRPDRFPLAAHRVDVRRQRKRHRRAQGLHYPRAQRPPGRAVRSRRAAALPRLQGVRLLHRPHPLRRRRLYGGLRMAKARIAIVGAGLMGHGIAQVFALAGHEVNITDTVVQNLDTVQSRVAANLRDLGDDESAAERVQPCVDLTEAVRDADFIVEAIAERLELKQKLFADIELRARRDAILASNTSVIPITAIMQSLIRRERALGTHWWNPPFLVPLVEVIETQWTSPQAIAWTMKLHEAAGKKPAHVKKDVPGFIGNRLQHALWR